MIEVPHVTELEAGKGERMSRSEQPQDSSMDEILASIRKIISDDEPEAPDADFLNAALEEFSGPTARPPEGYMGDLTRALASDPAPRASDDDIFDEAPPAPGYARRMSDALAEAIRAPELVPAPVPALVPESTDDDADLFEAGAAPAEEPGEEEPIEALEIAVETEVEDEEEEFIAELDDPISLGPEIELVDEVTDASVPDQHEVAEAPASPSVVMAMPEPSPAVSVALAPPPPPPPPVSVEVGSDVEELPTVEAAGLDEAQAPVAPVPPVEPMMPDVPPVAETAVEAALPPIVETGNIALIGDLKAQAAEPAPASSPELPPSIVASAGADEAPVMEATPAEPVAAGEASSPAETTVAVAVAVPPAAATPAVSEDVMAALLKPMLKEWLDANMPRIVAKAMGEDGKPDGETSPAS